ncbi:MAG: propionyl-CoA synthetase [Acidobacteriota bacterium]
MSSNQRAIDEARQRAATDPEGFWADAAQAIDWHEPWKRVLDAEAEPAARWFVGARVNTCHNALDRHVAAGRGNQPALFYDSPVADSKRAITYSELRDAVALFAGALRTQGVQTGDRVLIYMPMVPEAVIAMLACARLGAVHSVVFGGFAPRELQTRIDDAKPRVIVTASCGIEVQRIIPYKPLLDEAIELSENPPESCIVLQRPQVEAALVAGRDVTWSAALEGAEPADCVFVEATDPLYILYTSGTTGIPKGVVRDNGGHLVALAWSMSNVYGMSPGEVFWAASDIGWVVGHSYIVYAPLIFGCTSVLFEGKPVGTPDAGAFWRVISEYGVSALFTAPTAFRAIKREDPGAELLQEYDLTRFRTLFLAGERADPDTIRWAERHLGVPVIDHWWQTETGWPMVANCQGLGGVPVKHGSPSLPVPGYDIQVLDPEGRVCEADETGSIVAKLPLPPGCLPTLWNNVEGFRSSYLEDFPGYYLTGDAGFADGDGYVYIMSRTDDLINVAGHRLSTGGMEEVLAEHPDVAEAAVVGVHDALKGQLPLGFVVLNSGTTTPHDRLVAELIASVREAIGPVAAFKSAAIVDRLPKTRSGKVLRGTMRAIADGAEYKVPATIDDPTILDEIGAALAGLGYPRGAAP